MRDETGAGDDPAPRATILLVDDQPANLTGPGSHSGGPRPEPGHGPLRRRGAAPAAPARLRRHPPRRADAGPGRLRHRPAHPRPRAVPPHAHHLPDRLRQPPTSPSSGPTSWGRSITSSSRCCRPSCGRRRPSSSICFRRRSGCGGWSGANSSAPGRGGPTAGRGGARPARERAALRAASPSSTRPSWAAWAKASSPWMPTGLLTYMNPAAERLLGWTAEELLGRSIHDTHPPPPAPDGSPLPPGECAILRGGRRRGVAAETTRTSSSARTGRFSPWRAPPRPIVSDGSRRAGRRLPRRHAARSRRSRSCARANGATAPWPTRCRRSSGRPGPTAVSIITTAAGMNTAAFPEGGTGNDELGCRSSTPTTCRMVPRAWPRPSDPGSRTRSSIASRTALRAATAGTWAAPCRCATTPAA